MVLFRQEQVLQRHIVVLRIGSHILGPNRAKALSKKINILVQIDFNIRSEIEGKVSHYELHS